MNDAQSMMARQVGQAAVAFERQRTGHDPESVRVVLSGDTLVITLYGALSAVERAMTATPSGAAKLQEFHRQLFATASGPLRQEIRRITGVEVREATAEVLPATESVVGVFTTGTVIQVLLLAGGVAEGTWRSGERNDPDFNRPNLVESTRAAGGIADPEIKIF
jgi:uncharacterized protein YbcI